MLRAQHLRDGIPIEQSWTLWYLSAAREALRSEGHDEGSVGEFTLAEAHYYISENESEKATFEAGDVIKIWRTR